mmetsp:Transcript_2338/g.9199  ORF Transcript_2338/g.9199 Transcript_2338/m.9199 type:complete len:243 (-) Transcript_2338:164-892(-)
MTPRTARAPTRAPPFEPTTRARPPPAPPRAPRACDRRHYRKALFVRAIAFPSLSPRVQPPSTPLVCARPRARRYPDYSSSSRIPPQPRSTPPRAPPSPALTPSRIFSPHLAPSSPDPSTPPRLAPPSPCPRSAPPARATNIPPTSAAISSAPALVSVRTCLDSSRCPRPLARTPRARSPARRYRVVAARLSSRTARSPPNRSSGLSAPRIRTHRAARRRPASTPRPAPRPTRTARSSACFPA